MICLYLYGHDLASALGETVNGKPQYYWRCIAFVGFYYWFLHTAGFNSLLGNVNILHCLPLHALVSDLLLQYVIPAYDTVVASMLLRNVSTQILLGNKTLFFSLKSFIDHFREMCYAMYGIIFERSIRFMQCKSTLLILLNEASVDAVTTRRPTASCVKSAVEVPVVWTTGSVDPTRHSYLPVYDAYCPEVIRAQHEAFQPCRGNRPNRALCVISDKAANVLSPWSVYYSGTIICLR